jgi:hypothetical protein
VFGEQLQTVFGLRPMLQEPDEMSIVLLKDVA